MKEGWEYRKLKEIGRTQTGTTPSKSVKSFYGGEIPFIRPAELDIDGNGSIEYNSELKLTPEGALKSRMISANSTLMCCIGSVGKTGYATKNVTCNQQINTITPYEGYNGKFVYYALLTPSFQNEVIKIANSAKATLAIISKGKWEEMSIPVAPLSEQRAIVARLDSAFAHIDALKANAEKQLSEARQLFQKALEEAMTPKEGWEEKTLGDVGTFSRGINFAKSDFVKDGFPCIHYGQIHTTFGPVTYEHLTCIPNEMIRQDKLASKGNLIIAITSEDVEGSCKCTAWMGEYDIAVGAHAAIYKHKLHPVFVSYFFKSSLFQNEKEQYVHGFKVMEIKPSDIAKIHISYPSTEGQEQIVSYLDALSSHVRALEEKLKKMKDECDALKQAMLREVFE